MTEISSTGFRDTARMGLNVIPQKFSLPVTATKNARQGGIAVVTAGTGTAQPGTAATGLIAVGVFQKPADNTASLATPPQADIEAGVFYFNNSTSPAGDIIAAANFGQACYIVDDNTVALTDAGETRSAAGVIMGVSTDPATNGQVAVAIGLQNIGLLPAVSGGSPARLQSGSVTLVAGVGVVNTGIELTATSKIVLGRTAKGAGDMGVKEVAVITTPGIPGTAVLTITAQSVAGVTTATDIGTISYLIID